MDSKYKFLVFSCLVILLVGCNNYVSIDVSTQFITISTSDVDTPKISSSITHSDILIPSISKIFMTTPTVSTTFTSSHAEIPSVTPTPIALPHLLLVYWSDGKVIKLEPPSLPAVIIPFIGLYDITISGDGKKILFLSGSDKYSLGIGVININGSGGRMLLTDDDIAALETYSNRPDAKLIQESVVWVPKTHNILFNTSGSVYRGGDIPNNDLFSLDTDSGKIKRLFNKYSGGFSSPSPDGRIMVVQHNDVISINSINGSELFGKLIELTNNNVGVCFAPWYIYQIVWASDSSRFVINLPSEPCKTDVYDRIVHADTEVWSVDAFTGEKTLLGKLENSRDGVISPTLDHIWFTRPDDNSLNDESYLSTIDESVLLHLATGPAGFIGFTPDGNHFAYYHGILPDISVMIGSIQGKSFPLDGNIDPELFQWINNSQFIYEFDKTIWLGDIGGNTTPIISLSDTICCMDVKDLDFYKSNY